MSASLSPSQIARQIGSLRKHHEDQRVIGIHSTAGWAGESSLTIDGETIDVAVCISELEIRELLCSRAPDAPPLVIVTALTETELAQDVLARLARRKLYRVDRWDTLREVFGVRSLDARLGRSPWLVDAVLALPANGATRPASAEILSEDDLWETLLRKALGMPGGRPDLVALLEWTLTRDVGRWESLDEKVREGVRERVGETAGAAGVLLLDAVESGFGRDAVALGLVFDVVFDESVRLATTLAEAKVRLERFVGDRKIEPRAAGSWASAARELARRRYGAGDVAGSLHRADAIAAQLGIGDYLEISAILPGGADRRLARLGMSIESFLIDAGSLGEVRESARAARAHDLIGGDPRRRQSVEMAERLCGYLTTAPGEDASFADAARRYAREGGLVDLALSALTGGDPQPELSRALDRLRGRVLERCEADAKSFAELLRGWTEADGSRERAVPIEEVLDRVVVPVAERIPVLLIVLDGMSAAVFHELVSDLTSPSRGWVALRPEGDVAAVALSAPPVIAALPTLTEISRTSLLCGTLTNGTQAAEKKGFATHSGLVRISSERFPPRLFHKGELSGRRESDLSDEVREAIATEARVVGVVLNAVDDFLARSDQLRHSWRLDSIQYLSALFEAAYDAGRAVIMTSDHGHVLDTGSERRLQADADRFRLTEAEPTAGEIVLTGRRVVPSAGGRLVAAWSRDLRYAGKKAGYHGGASPQEVVVPLGVFAPPGIAIEGWRETQPFRPDWWLGEPVEPAAPKPVAVQPRPRKPAPPAGQQDLFTPAEPAPEPGETGPAWIDALLASETFRQQLEIAGRVAPSEAQIRQVLVSLSARGNKLTRTALTQQLGLPPYRVRGIVNGLRVVLNVDGYDVLAIDDASDSLAINLELLDKQFGLERD